MNWQRLPLHLQVWPGKIKTGCFKCVHIHKFSRNKNWKIIFGNLDNEFWYFVNIFLMFIVWMDWDFRETGLHMFRQIIHFYYDYVIYDFILYYPLLCFTLLSAQASEPMKWNFLPCGDLCTADRNCFRSLASINVTITCADGFLSKFWWEKLKWLKILYKKMK